MVCPLFIDWLTFLILAFDSISHIQMDWHRVCESSKFCESRWGLQAKVLFDRLQLIPAERSQCYQKLLELHIFHCLLTSHGRLIDLLFLDNSLYLAVRRTIEMGLKSLNFAYVTVFSIFTQIYCIFCEDWYLRNISI